MGHHPLSGPHSSLASVPGGGMGYPAAAASMMAPHQSAPAAAKRVPDWMRDLLHKKKAEEEAAGAW